jgi:hypothetical protein
LVFDGESHFELKSEVRGLTDFYLHDIEFEDLSAGPSFEFEFSLSKENKKKAPFFESMVKLRGKQLFKKLEELQAKNEPSFSIEVFVHYPDKVAEEKMDLSKLVNAGFKIYEVSKAKEYLQPARSVVDLHIEKLTDSFEHLSNYEILTLQLDTFEKYFELAVLNKANNFIVVHGIGEGKLRTEVHERLKQKSNVKSFVNQYHSLYGYGATEIYFSY